MIQAVPHMRIFLSVKPADFRKGIDTLAQLCRSELLENPFSGAMFLFINKRRTAIKILIYDGQGYWLCQKRLSIGKFKWWPRDTDSPTYRLMAHELQVLLFNGNPKKSSAAPQWRNISPA